jgi:hypothetical protein
MAGTDAGNQEKNQVQMTCLPFETLACANIAAARSEAL